MSTICLHLTCDVLSRFAVQLGSGANHLVGVNKMVYEFFGKIHAVVWYIFHYMADPGDYLPHGQLSVYIGQVLFITSNSY